MISRIFGDDSFLMDVGNLPISNVILLSVVLLFFLAVFFANTFFKRRMSSSKVAATIKIALLGFVLLLVESQARAVPGFGPLVGNLQKFIVLLCLANFVTYLLVDVFFYYRMKREVPSFLRDLFTSLVYVFFAMTMLRVIFHLDISSILTTTTVLTAAVAFAMQTTIANFFSGFYVQNDRNLRLKTWIALKEQDVVGEIVNVGFRYTTLKSLDQAKVMVPNNYIMQNLVTSLGYGEGQDRSKLALKVGLGYDFPPEKAKSLLMRILLQDKDVAKDPPPSVRVRNFADSSIEYDLVYCLNDYRTHLVTRGNLLTRIWYAVAREGRSIPFPHREVIAKAAREPFVVDGGTLLAVFRRTEILQSLSDEESRRLSERVHVRVFATGEAVVRQGDPGSSLFIVMQGELKVSIDGAEVGTLAGGEIFGEMSLLTGENRKATVTAATEAHLVEIMKEDIEPVIRSSPDLLDRLSAVLARREEVNREQRERMEIASADPGTKETFRQKLMAFFKL
jgi:small-conductance mechanosensitive channel/CRP-like cAMP-binding protein